MSGSVIQILYDGSDITNKVIVSNARFESQLNAVPGTFSAKCRDLTQTLDFVTGREFVLIIDGVRMWGGFLTVVRRIHAFDADDTTPVNTYSHRMFELQGVDYNVLFDRRILRNSNNFLVRIPSLTAAEAQATFDGEIITSALDNYSDMGGFDHSTYVDNVMAPNKYNPTRAWAWPEQGEKLRVLFDSLSKFEGQVYYIDAAKNVHWHSLERTQARWGFSDTPNHAAISTSTSTFQNATYGFREVEATEDGSVIVNDAMVWGGAAYTGDGATVFARYQDAVGSVTDTTYTYIQNGSVVPGSSIDTHGRWQMGEVHIGELGTKNMVKARANGIINGPPGSDTQGQQRGLRYPQWTFRFVWHSANVPSISGVKQHIQAGQVVTIEMNVFGVTKILPCRRLTISFPLSSPDGNAHVEFEGDFGIQPDDPFSLWAFLLKQEAKRQNSVSTYSTTSDTSTSTVYGAIGNFVPTPTANGAITTFSIPFGYIYGTLQVYDNGRLLTSGVTQSDPEGGVFTVSPAPSGPLFATARTLVG